MTYIVKPQKDGVCQACGSFANPCGVNTCGANIG